MDPNLPEDDTLGELKDKLTWSKDHLSLKSSRIKRSFLMSCIFRDNGTFHHLTVLHYYSHKVLIELNERDSLKISFVKNFTTHLLKENSDVPVFRYLTNTGCCNHYAASGYCYSKKFCQWSHRFCWNIFR